MRILLGRHGAVALHVGAVTAVLGAMLVASSSTPVAGAESFVRPQNDVALIKKLSLPASVATDLGSFTVTLPSGPMSLRIVGAVTLSNAGTVDVHGIIGPEVDGKIVGPDIPVTISKRSSTVAPILAFASNVAAGQHAVDASWNGDGALTMTGGTLSAVGLPYPGASGADNLRNNSASSSDTIAVSNAKFTQVLSVSLTTPDTTDVAADLQVSAKADATVQSNATVSVRVLLDGKPNADLWMNLKCCNGQSVGTSNTFRGVPSGTHTLAIEQLSSVSGVSFIGGTIGAIGLPSSLKTSSPIATTSTYGLPTTTAQAVPADVVATTIDTSGASGIATQTNIEMTGWIELQNPGSKAAKLTVQVVQNGAIEADDPVFTVTVPAHGQLSEAGLIGCNGVPIGVSTIGVRVTSNVPGVQVQVSYQRLIAWPGPTTP
jgi:hypothetical protein